MKKRHRGVFDPSHPAPYELSRSRIENFIKCRACFWLEQRKGVKPPEIPSFTLNTTTDILLKRDADAVRGHHTLPLWEAHGLGHMIPLEHPDLEKWTNSMQFGTNDSYFNFVKKNELYYNPSKFVIGNLIPLSFQLTSLIFGYIRSRKDKKLALDVVYFLLS